MPDVTGVTKAKMDQIDGDVWETAVYWGDDLLIVTKGGTWIAAGNTAKGPIGDVGPDGVPNPGDVTTARATYGPQPWQTLSLDPMWAAYGVANYGLPRCRIENTGVRFAGAIELVGAPLDASAGARWDDIVASPYLPAQFRPPVSIMPGYSRNMNAQGEIRLQSTGQFRVLTHSGELVPTGDVIYLDGIHIPLTV